MADTDKRTTDRLPFKQGFRTNGSHDGAKGFQMAFANHVYLSVQFGTGNYCDNRHTLRPSPLLDLQGNIQCANAEVAIFYSTEDTGQVWLTRECPYLNSIDDDVIGYITPDDLVKVVEWAAHYPIR